ncbi:MAG: STAS domain-containing protein [Thermochromatium sp.]
MKAPAQLTASEPGRWRLGGVLDFDSVPRLAVEGEALLRAAAARGQRSLVIDLAAVERANSAGLVLLLEWLEMAHQYRLSLCYTGLPESLQRLAAVSNLNDLLRSPHGCPSHDDG